MYVALSVRRERHLGAGFEIQVEWALDQVRLPEGAQQIVATIVSAHYLRWFIRTGGDVQRRHRDVEGLLHFLCVAPLRLHNQTCVRLKLHRLTWTSSNLFVCISF